MKKPKKLTKAEITKETDIEYTILAIDNTDTTPTYLKNFKYDEPNITNNHAQLKYFLIPKQISNKFKMTLKTEKIQSFESIYTYKFNKNKIFVKGDTCIDIDNIEELFKILTSIKFEKYKLYSTNTGFHLIIKNHHEYLDANYRILLDMLYIEKHFSNCWSIDKNFHTPYFPFRVLNLPDTIRHKFKKEKVNIGNNTFDLVLIDICNSCNLNCKYCFSNKKGAYLKLKTFKSILNNIKTNKIHMSGAGEPFLNPEIYEILKHATIQNKKVNMASHLLNINFKKMKNIKIDTIFCNITCWDKQSYLNEKQQTGNFEILIKNIKRCQKLGIKIFMTNIIHSENYKHIPKMIKFSKKYKLNGVSFRKFQAIESNKHLELTKKITLEILKMPIFKNTNMVHFKAQLRHENILKTPYLCQAGNSFCRFDVHGIQNLCCLNIQLQQNDKNLKFKIGQKQRCKHCGIFILLQPKYYFFTTNYNLSHVISTTICSSRL